MKVSEWLNDRISSHGIYTASELAQDFREQTGIEPCWPTHTVEDARAAIDARGLDGHVDDGPDVAYGYEIAAALEHKLAGTHTCDMFHGRGSRFRASVAAIAEVEK